MSAKRINIIVDNDFLEKIDDFAEKMQLSRSSCMSMCCAFTMLMPNGVYTLKDRKELVKYLHKYSERSLTEDDIQTALSE
jgi:hypothetical protein